MAASELIQDDDARIAVDPHPHQNSPTSPTSPPPSLVSNGNLARHASTPSADERDAGGGSRCSRLSSLLKQNQLVQSLNRLQRRCDYIKISIPEERTNRLPNEWWKTGVAFLYATVNLVFTTVVITVVHERVPDKSVSPPLPDKFFDYVDRVPWAFTVTEANGLILVGLWLVQWIFLKHKYAQN